GFDLCLNLSLVWPLAEQGLAASTAISAAGQVALLAWLIQQHIGRLDWRGLATTAGKAITATLAMSAACLALMRFLAAAGGRLHATMLVAGPVLVGLAVYAAAAWWLGIRELGLLFHGERDQARETDE